MLQKIKKKYFKIFLLFLSAAFAAKSLDLTGSIIVDLITYLKDVIKNQENYKFGIENSNLIDIIVQCISPIILAMLSFLTGRAGFNVLDEFFQKKVQNYEKLPLNVRNLVTTVEYFFGGGQTGNSSKTDKVSKDKNYLKRMGYPELTLEDIAFNMPEEHRRILILILIEHQLKYITNITNKESILYKIKQLNVVEKNLTIFNSYPTLNSLITKEEEEHLIWIWKVVKQKKILSDNILNETKDLVELFNIKKELKEIFFKTSTYLPIFNFIFQNPQLSNVIFMHTQNDKNMLPLIEKMFNSYFDVLQIERDRIPNIKIFQYNESKKHSLPHLTNDNIESIQNAFKNIEQEMSENQSAFYIQGIAGSLALFGYLAESTNSFLITSEENRNVISHDNPSFMTYCITKFSHPIQYFNK